MESAGIRDLVEKPNRANRPDRWTRSSFPGRGTNLQGKAVKEVELHFFLNGQKAGTGRGGEHLQGRVYEAKLKVPKGALLGAKVEVEAAKPAFETSTRMLLDKVLPERVDEKDRRSFWPISP